MCCATTYLNVGKEDLCVHRLLGFHSLGQQESQRTHSEAADRKLEIEINYAMRETYLKTNHIRSDSDEARGYQ